MSKLILALDEIQNLDEALALVKKVGHLLYAVKIHNMYDKFGPEVVSRLKEAGAKKVWVDHKLYDIPNTVKLRADSINADIISVHASGGLKMMREAMSSGKEIFAVTALTSFSEDEVINIYNRTLNETVLSLARLAKEAGVSGIVCSPLEVEMLKRGLGSIKLVVPGVRSIGANTNDQSRVSTPADAVKDGADLLVVGRQVTQSEDPVAEIEKILKEINF